jgi:hypothetical protein
MGSITENHAIEEVSVFSVQDGYKPLSAYVQVSALSFWL